MDQEAINRCYSQYLQALIAGQEDEAIRAVDSALSVGVHPEELYVQVFQPALRQIGLLWQHNQFHVAEEHLATAITRRLMARFTQYFRAPIRSLDRTIVLACVAGEFHEVGLQMASDLYERHGWRVVYLGSNVPTEDLVDMVERLQPDVVGLSATLSYHLPTLQDAVSSLRAHGCRARIVVGGYAFHGGADLATRMGAELWTNDGLQTVERTLMLFEAQHAGPVGVTARL